MTEIQFPPFLHAGDKIGITAPASVVRYEDILPGIRLFTENWGLQVIEGKTLHSAFNQFSDTDENRLAEFQQMLDDPSVKAIVAARGGYGCSRIVDRLDFTGFMKSPKWIAGFSDLTVFLSRIYQLGYASIHAQMAKSIAIEGGTVAAESLKQILFGELPSYLLPAHALNRYGMANAEVIGGNLCMLAHMIGSETEMDTSGKILFIEDIGEYLYNLDRMMIQMKRSGKLDNLAGLIVGQFTDMKDNARPTFGKNANEIIHEHVAGYNYPVCFDFPVGHVADNRAMGIGMHAHLEINEKFVEFQFSPSAPTII
jgi:muramoyltetrapeptide carboxypeptidase